MVLVPVVVWLNSASRVQINIIFFAEFVAIIPEKVFFWDPLDIERAYSPILSIVISENSLLSEFGSSIPSP